MGKCSRVQQIQSSNQTTEPMSREGKRNANLHSNQQRDIGLLKSLSCNGQNHCQMKC